MENKYLSVFKPYNGFVVKYKGINHIIKYYEHNAIYPYNHISRSCYLEPEDKSAEYYQDIKKMLGDDWSTDITTIAPYQYMLICQQLGILEEILYNDNLVKA